MQDSARDAQRRRHVDASSWKSGVRNAEMIATVASGKWLGTPDHTDMCYKDVVIMKCMRMARLIFPEGWNIQTENPNVIIGLVRVPETLAAMRLA